MVKVETNPVGQTRVVVKGRHKNIYCIHKISFCPLRYGDKYLDAKEFIGNGPGYKRDF